MCLILFCNIDLCFCIYIRNEQNKICRKIYFTMYSFLFLFSCTMQNFCSACPRETNYRSTGFVFFLALFDYQNEQDCIKKTAPVRPFICCTQTLRNIYIKYWSCCKFFFFFSKAKRDVKTQHNPYTYTRVYICLGAMMSSSPSFSHTLSSCIFLASTM